MSRAVTTPAWQRAIDAFPGLLHLAPPAVHPSDPLPAVVSALSSDPVSRCVFVTDAEDHLLGAIPERRLDADLFKLVLPQPLWATLGELDARELMLAAKGQAQKAGELMTPCPRAEANDQLGSTLVDMIRSGHNDTAVVDEQNRLLGYLSLFEILAELLRQSDT